jgi:hypothetical protein
MISWVSCKLHRRPEQGCSYCAVAREIDLRLLHERGECGGIGWCAHCEFFGDTSETGAALAAAGA